MAEQQTSHYVIVHRDRQGRETVYPVTGDVIDIGRASTSDVCIGSQFVSRRHGRIRRIVGGWVYEDQDSTSGSFLDGSSVSKTPLPPGTWIHLGTPTGHALKLERADPTDDSMELKPTAGTEILRRLDLDQSRYVMAETATRVMDAAPAGRLASLYELGASLTASRDRLEVFELVLDAVLDQLPAERAAVIIREPGSREPEAQATRVSREPGGTFQPSRVLSGLVMRDQVGLVSRDASSDESLPESQTLAFQAVRSVIVAPVTSTERTWGALYLDTLTIQTPYDQESLEFLLAVGRQLGLILESLYLITEQERMLESLMEVLAASIDARDGLTAGHSSRVAGYARRVAERLAWPSEECKRIYWAGLLHDYGKIGIDDEVLRKPGRLTSSEFRNIRTHPKLTHDILCKIHFPEGLEDLPFIAATHHERMDGEGYPFGLSGEDFPEAGQLIGIADVFDALTQERHYRQPMGLEEVLDILREGKHGRWDPVLVDAFLAFIDDEIRDEMGTATFERQTD
jgi:HD-GYP domain-containing protein (c-di-GMP phosphodiesterase class II)